MSDFRSAEGGSSPDVSDHQPLLALALAVAREAGAGLVRRMDHVHTVQLKTSATDPVSEADRASEELLVARITAERPDDGILGEEGADREGTSGLRWVIDPLDGTVNYLYGIAAWCVSVAVEDADGALVGVVHDPVNRETFQAVRGGGAWLGEQRLAVSDPVPLDRALLATGFAYDASVRQRQAAVLARLLPQVRDVRRAGSAALDLCSVAVGRADGYYEDSTQLWDWAAGALIAAEAGATVTRLRDGVLAAGPTLHRALGAALERAGD